MFAREFLINRATQNIIDTINHQLFRVVSSEVERDLLFFYNDTYILFIVFARSQNKFRNH